MSRRAVAPPPPPQFCGGINWDSDNRHDPWRCGGVMREVDGWDETLHQCAASHDHTGDHCCALGHRWPQYKRRRRWRDRLRRRQPDH